MGVKFKFGLLGRIALAMALGVALGKFGPAFALRSLNTFAALFGQFVKFIVPFIILGFVTPAIAETGKNAGRMLLVTVALAIGSTLFSGWFAFAAGQAVFPLVLEPGTLKAAAAAAKSFPPYFTLAIPPPCDVVTSLVAAFMLGLGMVATGGERLFGLFSELREIVSRTVAKALVPLLPVYVAAVIADMTACGRLAPLAGPAVRMVLCCIAFSVALLLLQYTLAGAVARKNPLRALWNMLPAYLTGWGCCSSAATIPVTLRQTLKNGVDRDAAELVIPLGANIHLSGSICCMVTYATAFMFLAGEPVPLGAITEFIGLIAILAVAAPGVPGGVILASKPIVESVLGFTPERYALMAAVYLALDGLGTSCNLTGDGALALIVNRFGRKSPCAG